MVHCTGEPTAEPVFSSCSQAVRPSVTAASMSSFSSNTIGVDERMPVPSRT